MLEKEYAKALWELAIEENKSELFRDYFEIIREIKNEDFYAILSSPVINKSDKKDIIKNVFKKFDETFVNFLYVLIDYNRFELVDSIGHQYRKHYREFKNIVIVDIYSSKDLNKRQLSELKETLEKKYDGKTIEMKITIDPELIGGLRIIQNGESIDLNLKNSLDKLRETM